MAEMTKNEFVDALATALMFQTVVQIGLRLGLMTSEQAVSALNKCTKEIVQMVDANDPAAGDRIEKVGKLGISALFAQEQSEFDEICDKLPAP